MKLLLASRAHSHFGILHGGVPMARAGPYFSQMAETSRARPAAYPNVAVSFVAETHHFGTCDILTSAYPWTPGLSPYLCFTIQLARPMSTCRALVESSRRVQLASMLHVRRCSRLSKSQPQCDLGRTWNLPPNIPPDRTPPGWTPSSCHWSTPWYSTTSFHLTSLPPTARAAKPLIVVVG